MSTASITTFATLDKPLDIARMFQDTDQKPSRVKIVITPEYEPEGDQDPDWVEVTEKNKQAYKQAMIELENGEVYTIPSSISTEDEFIAFLKR